ncbi:MAG: outer membrane protein [Alphaproteobacteria bacterium]
MRPDIFLKRFLLTAFALGICFALPVEAAQEEEDDIIYVAGSIGYSMLSDFEYNGNEDRTIGYSSGMEDDIDFRLAIGDRGIFGRYFRLEAELSYAEYDAEATTVTDSNTDPATVTVDAFNDQESIQLFSLMGNIYWDLWHGSKVSPYLGGGVGLTRVRHKYYGDRVLRDDTVLTFQGMIGVSIPVAQNLALTIGGSYKMIDDSELVDKRVQDRKVSREVDSLNQTSVNLGLRYRF